MRTSALHPMSHDTISILESAGSRGNSTIRRPVGVKAPESGDSSTVTLCLLALKRMMSGRLTARNTQNTRGLEEGAGLQMSWVEKFGSSDLHD